MGLAKHARGWWRLGFCILGTSGGRFLGDSQIEDGTESNIADYGFGSVRDRYFRKREYNSLYLFRISHSCISSFFMDRVALVIMHDRMDARFWLDFS